MLPLHHGTNNFGGQNRTVGAEFIRLWGYQHPHRSKGRPTGFGESQINKTMFTKVQLNNQSIVIRNIKTVYETDNTIMTSSLYKKIFKGQRHNKTGLYWNDLLYLAIPGYKQKRKTPEPAKLTICSNCNKTFFKQVARLNKTRMSFCSSNCAASYNNKNRSKEGFKVSKLERWLQNKLILEYPCLDFRFNSTTDINYELDIYIPKLNVAFEINGPFHYIPIYGTEKLEQVKRNDVNKIRLCKERNIVLYIVDTSEQSRFTENSSVSYWNFVKQMIDEVYIRSESEVVFDISIYNHKKEDRTCCYCSSRFHSSKNDTKFCSFRCRNESKMKVQPNHSDLLQFSTSDETWTNAAKRWRVSRKTIHKWLKLNKIQVE